MMTNEELAQAIGATQNRLHKVGTAYAEHPILVEHLRKLLVVQLARASESTPKKMFTQDHHYLQGEHGYVWHQDCGCEQCWKKYKQIVAVKPLCFDSRNGWDTHMVAVEGQAVGFTDGPCSEADAKGDASV